MYGMQYNQGSSGGGYSQAGASGYGGSSYKPSGTYPSAKPSPSYSGGRGSGSFSAPVPPAAGVYGCVTLLPPPTPLTTPSTPSFLSPCPPLPFTSCSFTFPSAFPVFLLSCPRLPIPPSSSLVDPIQTQVSASLTTCVLIISVFLSWFYQCRRTRLGHACAGAAQPCTCSSPESIVGHVSGTVRV